MTVLIFIVALSILVAIHEWGHFIMAKKAGIRVDIFSIGFGPKLLGFTWHGTEYRIAPIPLGGYVKIYGQDPLEEAEGDEVKAKEIEQSPDSFSSKTYLQKMGVVFGGPVMNIVLCLVLLPLVFMAGRLQHKVMLEKPAVIDVVQGSPAEQIGLQKNDLILEVNNVPVATWQDYLVQIVIYPEQEIDLKYSRAGEELTTKVTTTLNPQLKQPAGYLGVEPFEFVGNEPVIDKVGADTPAEAAGLMAGDVVKKIGDTDVRTWMQMTELIQKQGGESVALQIERSGESKEITLNPKKDEASGRWILGVSKINNPDDMAVVNYGFVESIQLGVQEFKKLVTMTFDILGRLFTGDLSIKTLGGPLQIATATSKAAESGMGDFLYLLAFLSLQLGIMNLLPIPVLDGGHVVILSIEAIIRRSIPAKIRNVAMYTGLIMLLSLMAFVTINDVNNVFGFSLFDKIGSLF